MFKQKCDEFIKGAASAFDDFMHDKCDKYYKPVLPFGDSINPQDFATRREIDRPFTDEEAKKYIAISEETKELVRRADTVFDRQYKLIFSLYPSKRSPSTKALYAINNCFEEFKGFSLALDDEKDTDIKKLVNTFHYCLLLGKEVHKSVGDNLDSLPDFRNE